MPLDLGPFCQGPGETSHQASLGHEGCFKQQLDELRERRTFYKSTGESIFCRVAASASSCSLSKTLPSLSHELSERLATQPCFGRKGKDLEDVELEQNEMLDTATVP